MIIAIRRYLKGPAFKAVLWLTLISVAGFWGLPSLFRRSGRGGAGGQAVVTVNGTEVSSHDFNRATHIQQEFLRRLRMQYGQYADLFIQAMGLNADPKSLALDILIRETIINQEADLLRINVMPGYIESRLESPEFIQKQLTQILPAYVFDETGNINPAALNNYLSREHLTSEELNDLIKEALSRELVLEFIGAASYVPQFVMQQEFVCDFAKKQFSLLTISFEPVLKKEQTKQLTEDEVKKFFDMQNRTSKRYWTQEKRKGTTWTFDAKKFGVTVDDAEAETYYKDYRGQKFVSVPMKLEVRTIVLKNTDQATIDKAVKISQELQSKPEEFATKAREISQDKETAKNGGLVPFFSKGTYDKAFEKAAFLLKNDGDISQPVTTSRGIEIVQRVSKKDAEFKPFDMVKNEIKELLTVEKFKQEFSEAMTTLMDQNNGAELKKFIDAHGATQGTLAMTEGDAGKAAKAIAGLREKGAMTSFYESDKAVIVRLDEIQKREQPALESVRARVEDDLHREHAAKAFEKMVKETAAQAIEAPLATLAKAVGGSVEPINLAGAGDKEALEALRKRDVPVEQMVRLDKVGSIATYLDLKNAYIVRLDTIEALDANEYQEKKQELAKKLDQEYSSYFVEGFVASLYRNATIKTSEEMANTAREDDYIPTEDYF